MKALLPEADSGFGPEVRELSIHQIEPSPDQPRKRIDPDRLSELADSIRARGLIQPVVVRPNGETYELVVGERRWRAALEAGLERIPALVIDPPPEERLVLGLVENIQREELGPLEEADAYRVLQEEHGLTQEQVAQAVGKSRVAVTNSLRLLKLPAMVREMLITGQLTAGHGRAILTARSAERQVQVARQAVRQGLSVRQTEEVARRLETRRAPREEPDDPRTLSLLDLGDRMGRRLGSRIRVVPRRRGARFIIDCGGDDEIEAMIDLLGLR